MRWFLVLCIAAVLAGAVCGDCEACLDGWCYNKHVLPAESAGTSRVIDRNTNTLYVISYPSYSRIRQCNLDSKTCNEYNINGIEKIAVHPRTGDIYGSGNYYRKNIYRLDISNNAQHVAVPNVKASVMQYIDKLYYIGEYSGINTYENGVSRRITGTQGYDVASFVIDKNNDIYFSYLARGPPIVTSRWSNGVIYHDDFLDTISFVTIDKDGNALFTNNTYPNTPPIASTNIYRKINGELVQVGAMNDWPYGEPIFDRDNNIVYATSDIEPHIHLIKDSAECAVENNTIKVRPRTA